MPGEPCTRPPSGSSGSGRRSSPTSDSDGPFEGGDVCLRRAAVANAFVGTSLGPSPEIRLAVLWYAVLIAFYPDSPFVGEAQEYLLAQGFAGAEPGRGPLATDTG